jgi:hypothetical protein
LSQLIEGNHCSHISKVLWFISGINIGLNL